MTDPLTPTDCDLRDFQYMELDVRSLRDSRFAAQVSGDAFRAGVLLWCAAWHQVPAGSLPDDDIELANLAGYGRFAKEWRKVRDEALTKFIKCTDGRLYHQEVAKKALAAWNAKLHHHYERARDRLRKANKARTAENLPLIPEFSFDQWNELRIATATPMEKADASAGIPATSAGNSQKSKNDSAGIPPENALKGNGEGEGKGEGEFLIPSVPTGTGGKPPVDTERADLWRAMRALFADRAIDDKAAGAFLAKLVKTHTDFVALEAMRGALANPPGGDIRAWLEASCQTIAGRRPKAKSAGFTDEQRAAANAASTAEAAALLGFTDPETFDA